MVQTPKILPRSFYEQPTRKVARFLIGKTLAVGKCTGKIVETEAYFGKNDPASHAASKSRKRNYVMFAAPGTAYVYLAYGTHWMLNVVTEPRGIPGAVLIRALEPLQGMPTMERRRGDGGKNLTSGPGKLTQALNITGNENNQPLSRKEFCIIDAPTQENVTTTTRIGISRGKEALLRFYLTDNPFVSRK